MTQVLGVHGFMYDPKDKGKDNPEHLWRKWEQVLGNQHKFIGYPWWSVPISFRNVLKSWSKGYAGCYNYAWALAKEEGEKVKQTISSNIMCHSLGSRVVLEALMGQVMRDRVLILNGAEHSHTALEVARMNRSTKFLNIVVRTDDVLKGPGTIFSPKHHKNEKLIGQSGLYPNDPFNWIDIVLDSPRNHEWGLERGYDLQGDNPKKIGDHQHSYMWSGNWGLYRDFFSGELDYMFGE